jgi:hypothetical protein
MGLEITFDCRAYNGKLPNLEFGVHLILRDGCAVDLSENPQNLSEAQRKSLELAKTDDKRKHRLCYLPCKLVDNLFDSHGNFKVSCPTCGNDYVLTREQYERAYNNFARGE